MSDYGYRSPRHNPRNAFARMGEWLSRRPMESWGFFIAGFLIARVIF
jgi:hypothetical protein